MLSLFYSYMNDSFSMNPKYWNTLATYELENPSNETEIIKIKYECICVVKLMLINNSNVICTRVHMFFSQKMP